MKKSFMKNMEGIRSIMKIRVKQVEDNFYPQKCYFGFIWLTFQVPDWWDYVDAKFKTLEEASDFARENALAKKSKPKVIIHEVDLNRPLGDKPNFTPPPAVKKGGTP